MKRKIFWVIIILVIIGAGGISAYYLLNGGTTEPEEQANTVTNVESSNTKTTFQTLEASKELSELTKLITAASLKAQLEGTEQLTIFAPTNKSLDALDDSTKTIIIDAGNVDVQQDILKYHIVSGSALLNQLADGQKIKTLLGSDLVVKIENKETYIIDAKGNKAKVTKADVKTSNGVIHIIDSVLLPQ
jgi:uncharacterized surface protein with fasciclin (FAS1) repeats